MVKKIRRSSFGALGVLCLLSGTCRAAQLSVRVEAPPLEGALQALLFDSPNAFGDLRDPKLSTTVPVGVLPFHLTWEVPPGEYALLVFRDQNGNGRLDRNFLGIPREPLGFSEGYRPKGPPVFARASFRVQAGEVKTISVSLKSVFEKRGLWGVGLGAIAQSRPYRGAESWAVRPIPVVTYIGERWQILGPQAQWTLASRRRGALALSVQYRLGAYAESDSPWLQGMGDRRATWMGGAFWQGRGWGGLAYSGGYVHDLLQRSRGGLGRFRVSKSFQWGAVTLGPQAGANWMSSALSQYEFGVPGDKIRPDRPAHRPGSVWVPEWGATLTVDGGPAWQGVFHGHSQEFPSAITQSPLVNKSRVVGGFFALVHRF